MLQCLLTNVPVYRMTRASMPSPENPILGQAMAAVAQGTTAILALLQDQNAQTLLEKQVQPIWTLMAHTKKVCHCYKANGAPCLGAPLVPIHLMAHGPPNAPPLNVYWT